MLTGDLTGISQVIEGDLIYSKESRTEEPTSVGTSEADNGHADSSEIDISSEILPEENIQSVKVAI
jgi:tRNA pseudouridine13 synthase